MIKLFLDSGAYSAYQNKTSINIKEYMDFIRKHNNHIEVYANLDSIGSAEETWKNQREMEKNGLKPIPVFHLNESDKYLEMCMQYDYFAVGGLASAKGHSLKPFLQRVFEKVCPKSNDYYPTHKIHGFGIAAPEIITSFPWYSIDSTSWVQYGRFGIILIPKIKYGKVTYKEPPYTIAISSKSKAVGDENHFKNFTTIEKKYITDYCNEKGFVIGKTLTKNVPKGYVLKENESWIDRKTKMKIEKIVEKGLCCNGEMRDSLNLLYFLDLEKNQPKYPWRYLGSESLF
jgi:hypothetical protein